MSRALCSAHTLAEVGLKMQHEVDNDKSIGPTVYLWCMRWICEPSEAYEIIGAQDLALRDVEQARSLGDSAVTSCTLPTLTLHEPQPKPIPIGSPEMPLTLMPDMASLDPALHRSGSSLP